MLCCLCPCTSGLRYLMSQNIEPIVSFVCQAATLAIEVRIDAYQQVLCKQTHCYIYSEQIRTCVLYNNVLDSL